MSDFTCPKHWTRLYRNCCLHKSDQRLGPEPGHGPYAAHMTRVYTRTCCRCGGSDTRPVEF